jgi:hypothetical protein
LEIEIGLKGLRGENLTKKITYQERRKPNKKDYLSREEKT